jgi:hypothetical protein
MCRHKKREFEQICKLASEHAAAVIHCIDALCPALDLTLSHLRQGL